MKETNWEITAYKNFCSGNDDMFIEIVKEYRIPITKYINLIINDYHSAEDISQEVFLKLIVHKPFFKDGNSFKSWLFTIAHNMAIDYLRKHNRHINVEFTTELENVLFTIDDYNYDTGEFGSLQSFFNNLPLKYQQLIKLKFINNLSNYEIAKILKKSTRAIDGMIYRVKQDLKKYLGGISYENR